MTPVGLEPTTYGLRRTSAFAAAPECGTFVRWTLPLPSPEVVRHPPSSLYTFRNSHPAWLGVGTMRCHIRPFTEFDGIHAHHFGCGVPKRKSVALPAELRGRLHQR
jgi:hypothetical protein